MGRFDPWCCDLRHPQDIFMVRPYLRLVAMHTVHAMTAGLQDKTWAFIHLESVPSKHKYISQALHQMCMLCGMQAHRPPGMWHLWACVCLRLLCGGRDLPS